MAFSRTHSTHPCIDEGNTDQVAPSLGSQPTLLRKTDAIEESTRPKQQERAQEVLASRKPAVQPYPTLPSTPAQKNAKNSESGRQPPPKVTWQQGHTRSPWRLNQTGRTLLNPQTVTPQPSVEELRRRVNPQEEEVSPVVQRRLADKVIRIRQTRGTISIRRFSGGSSPFISISSGCTAGEWSPVRKGTMRDAVFEQGTIRAAIPPTQMELPPSQEGSRIVSERTTYIVFSVWREGTTIPIGERPKTLRKQKVVPPTWCLQRALFRRLESFSEK